MNTEKILLVDDERAIRLAVRTALTREGMQVTEAADGSEALELLKKQQFHLVILDVMMEHVGGYDVLQAMRAAGDHTPVMMLSGKSDEMDQVLGLGFGVLLQSKGYGAGWALAMGGLIYAGSMQYVAIDLLAGGASLISAAIMTLMVNARHLFYGISMLERYKNTGAAKPYLIFALTDETYSVVCSGDAPEGVDQSRYFFWVSLLDQFYWVVGCVAGALLGSGLPFDTTGIDFSMTALFLVVFTEQWKSTKDHRSAIAGVAASVLCLLVFGPSSFLIPSMISITVILTVMRGRRRTESAQRTA